MDGQDDAGCLLVMDDIGQLNEQVDVLQADTIFFIDGESWRFVVFLPGDVKLMALMNGGGNCWRCDDVTILCPSDPVLEHFRWGSFMRASRRTVDWEPWSRMLAV